MLFSHGVMITQIEFTEYLYNLDISLINNEDLLCQSLVFYLYNFNGQKTGDMLNMYKWLESKGAKISQNNKKISDIIFKIDDTDIAEVILNTLGTQIICY